MRRLWLRWALLIIFVAVLGIVFVNLGEWQLDRLAQRRGTQRDDDRQRAEARFSPTRRSSPARSPTLINGSGSRPAAPSMQTISSWCVTAAMAMPNGYEIVTPLRTASGVVLVDRGFIPA